MCHHTDLLLLFLRVVVSEPLGIAGRSTFFPQSSLSNSFLKEHSHSYHFCKIPRCASNHSLVVKRVEGFKKDSSQLLVFQWRDNLSSKSPPSLSGFHEGLFVSLSHCPELFPIRGHIRIVAILVDEGICQVIEGTDSGTV